MITVFFPYRWDFDRVAPWVAKHCPKAGFYSLERSGWVFEVWGPAV